MKTPDSMTDYLKLTNAQKMELAGLPSVPSNALLADLYDRILSLPDRDGETVVSQRWVKLWDVLGIIDAALTEETRKANVALTRGGTPSSPTAGSPSFRAEVERIANDYIPDNDGQAPQALSEMRDALQSLLANESSRLGMDNKTDTLKTELKRLHVETAERVVCRRLPAMVR